MYDYLKMCFVYKERGYVKAVRACAEETMARASEEVKGV